MSAAACPHSLGPLKRILASGPFRFQCTYCGGTIYREHPRTASVSEFLSRDPIVTPIVIFVLAIVFLPWVVSAFALVHSVLYAWDIYREPLKVLTDLQQAMERKTNLRILVVVVVLFLAAAWSAAR